MSKFSHSEDILNLLKCVALTGRNYTGPPCSVGRWTTHTIVQAPGGQPAEPPAAFPRRVPTR